MPYDYHSYASQIYFFLCPVVDGICCNYRKQIFDIRTFQTKIKGGNPTTVFLKLAFHQQFWLCQKLFISLPYIPIISP